MHYLMWLYRWTADSYDTWWNCVNDNKSVLKCQNVITETSRCYHRVMMCIIYKCWKGLSKFYFIPVVFLSSLILLWRFKSNQTTSCAKFRVRLETDSRLGRSSNQFNAVWFRIDVHATVAVAVAAVVAIALRVLIQLQSGSCHNNWSHSTDMLYWMSFLLIDLTGPCGGKTTGQSRLCTFFENLGWKVSYQWGDSPIDLSGLRG